jgi:hypothetical protein
MAIFSKNSFLKPLMQWVVMMMMMLQLLFAPFSDSNFNLIEESAVVYADGE